MNLYVTWVSENPLLSAAIQFGLLGTLGEFISAYMRNKKLTLIGNWWQILCKILAWALLGIIIKYGFVGMKGAVRALIDHHLLPRFLAAGFGWAFAVSVVTNLFFGPQMMFIHRLEDNLIDWKWDITGLQNAFLTLIWFWIPAHTVTFLLPKEMQIGLAAIWSVVLGVIMGISVSKKQVIS